MDNLGYGGALTVFMRNVLLPMIIWMVEGTLVIVHASLFSNITMGKSSIVANKLALRNWLARMASLLPRTALGPTLA